MARGWSSAPLLAGLLAAACGMPPPSLPQKLDVYLYEDTRQSLDLVPGLYGGVPAWLRPLLDSSLTLTTVIAVVLTQLLRGGTVPAASPPVSE